VVLDIVMPGISGLEVLQQIHERDADLPVVILTGHVNSQNARLGTPQILPFRCRPTG